MTEPLHFHPAAQEPPPNHTIPLQYGRFRAVMKPTRPLFFPRFAGSMFRGAFGWALKRVICVTRTHECPPCLLKDRCLFPYVYETPPPASTAIMRKYRTAPHPFVLRPALPATQPLPPHTPIELELLLFGKILLSLPYFIFALERMGNTGLGRARVPCRLVTVEAFHAGKTWLLYSPDDSTPKPADGFAETVALDLPSPLQPVPATYSRIRLTLLTPLRLIYQERLATALPFHVLIRQLLRRLALLSYFHCGGPAEGIPFREWIALAEQVRLTSQELQWFDWERYSSRQQTTMALGGLLGTVSYEGPIAPFLPLLKLGELIHVGKGTSFGLGRYTVEPLG